MREAVSEQNQLVRIPYQLKRRLCNVLSVFEEI